MCARIHTRTRARIHTRTHTHAHTRTHTHAHAYTRAHAHAYTRAHAHAYTRARIHTQARKHALFLLFYAIANCTKKSCDICAIFLSKNQVLILPIAASASNARTQATQARAHAHASNARKQATHAQTKTSKEHRNGGDLLSPALYQRRSLQNTLLSVPTVAEKTL